ncbi:MAG: hypothetical protein AB1815_08425 [Bacillota bacterium]
MAVERLLEEIKKLSAKQKEELLQKLGLMPLALKENLRGGKDDPLAEIIGIGEGPENGSTTYKEDLYGNKRF